MAELVVVDADCRLRCVVGVDLRYAVADVVTVDRPIHHALGRNRSLSFHHVWPKLSIQLRVQKRIQHLQVKDIVATIRHNAACSVVDSSSTPCDHEPVLGTGFGMRLGLCLTKRLV